MSNAMPTIVELDVQPVVLNAGELHVLNWLLALDSGWTIYVQPNIAGLQPDFIAAHSRHGLCVIEVRDWATGEIRQAPGGALEMHRHRRWVPTDESPSRHVDVTRRAVVDEFFSNVAETSGAASDDSSVVRGIVVLPRFSTAQACALLRRAPTMDAQNWTKVWGGQALVDDPLCVVTGHPRRRPLVVSPLALARLRRHCANSSAVFSS